MASSFAGIFTNSDPTGAGLSGDLYQNEQRQNSIDIGKEQAKQEAIATQELTDRWKAGNLYNDLVKKAMTQTPKPGYYDPALAGQRPTLAQPSQPSDAGGPSGAPVSDNPDLAAAMAARDAAPMSGDTPVSPNLAGGASNSMAAAISGAPAIASPATVAPPAGIGANSIAGGIQATAPVATLPPVPVGPDNKPLEPMDAKDPSTYDVNIDFDKVNRGLAAAGYASQGNAIQSDRVKAQTAVVDMYIKQHADAAAKMGSLANLLTAIPLTDFNSTDPQTLQQQQQASHDTALQQLRYGVQAGVIDPSMEAGLEQQIRANGWTPQLQQQLIALSKSTTSAHEQQVQAVEQWNAHKGDLSPQGPRTYADANIVSEGNRRDMENQTSQIEMNQKNLATASQTVPQTTDKATLDRFIAQQPAGVQQAISNVYNEKDIPGTVKAIAALGQTAEQKAAMAIRQAGQDSLDAYRDSALDIRKQLASIAEERAAKGTAADKAAIRTAQTRVLGLEKQEQPIYKMIGQLQTALKGGNAYVTNTGNVQSRTPDDGEKSDMTTRLNSAITTAQNLINTKYDIMEEQGGTPRVSREDALAGVGAVRQTAKSAPAVATPQTTPKTTASPAPAVTPKPTTSAASKPIDAATLNGYLKKAGWGGSGASTPAQRSKAQQLAEADGYRFPK